MPTLKLRVRQRFGQYRIEGKLSSTSISDVYRAYDTVEGVRVALKLPLGEQTPKELEAFRREVRTVASLDHPNILPIKTATTIDGRFVIVTSLGEESLADRLERRMARETAWSFGEQLLEALAYAHRKRLAHLDVKPENLIVFPGGRLRLADFGLARTVYRTRPASGSGTVGYAAPEQVMGRPSIRSDVFAAGLVLWRLFGGPLPEWPFRWPYERAERVEERFGPDALRLVRRATQVDQDKRYQTAIPMLAALQRAYDRSPA